MLFSRRARGGPEWIVCFLGNPGRKYENTRHNLGFLTADELERRHGLRITRLKYSALTCVGELGGVQALFMKPQTYMNLSGDAVAPAAAFYRIEPAHILVVSDDVSLPPGKLRIRKKGSAGGHNGLKSVIARLGTEDFPRIKLGIGAPPHPDYELADWVLGTPSKDEQAAVNDMISRAADAVETVLRDGVDAAMNKYSG